MNRYRLKDIETTMRREDVELVKLSAALAAEQDPAKQAEIKKAMKVREGKILPIFQQIAVQFADLHDTPGRMAAAGVIKQQVDWATSRSYFYWRLRRRLAEFQIRRQVCNYDASMTPVEASATLEAWFKESGQPEEDWKDSRRVLSWIADKQQYLRQKLDDLRIVNVANKAAELAKSCPEGAAQGIVDAFQQMDQMQQEVLRQQLLKIR